MIKKLIWSVALVMSFVLSQSVLADCGKNLRAMVESLKIDDAQKAKIMPVLDNLKTTLQGSVGQLRDLSKQINQQSFSASMDQNAVNSLVDQKTKAIGDIIKAKVAAKNQIFTVLNDQQKAQLQTMMQDMEKKMEEKWQACREENS